MSEKPTKVEVGQIWKLLNSSTWVIIELLDDGRVRWNRLPSSPGDEWSGCGWENPFADPDCAFIGYAPGYGPPSPAGVAPVHVHEWNALGWGECTVRGCGKNADVLCTNTKGANLRACQEADGSTISAGRCTEHAKQAVPSPAAPAVPGPDLPSTSVRPRPAKGQRWRHRDGKTVYTLYDLVPSDFEGMRWTTSEDGRCGMHEEYWERGEMVYIDDPVPATSPGPASEWRALRPGERCSWTKRACQGKHAFFGRIDADWTASIQDIRCAYIEPAVTEAKSKPTALTPAEVRKESPQSRREVSAPTCGHPGPRGRPTFDTGYLELCVACYAENDRLSRRAMDTAINGMGACLIDSERPPLPRVEASRRYPPSMDLDQDVRNEWEW